MRAKVIVYDDEHNDYPKGAYELMPSRIVDNGISTTYIFEFEYHKLNENLMRGRNEN